MTTKLDTQFRTSISHLALSAGLAVSLTAIATTASAQQTQGSNSLTLDTITIEGATGPAEGDYNVLTASSPKQTAPLLNTPQTVTVIPQAIIQETGARNLTEVLRNTPGITFDAGENGFSTSLSNFKLRGFDTSGSVFVDGVRSNGSFPRDTFNIDRVEVFKGAAADNGRGSAGGYVNMVTKLPSLRNFTSGEVGFGFSEHGNEPQKRGTVDLNYAIGENTAVRLNGMLEQSGIPGRDEAENKAWGIAPSIAFGLGTDFRTFIAYEHISRRDRPDWGVPGASINGMVHFDPVAGLAPRNAFYGLRSDFDNVDADSVLGRVEYDISDRITISNQTNWTKVDRFARYTVPFGYDTATGLVTTQRHTYDRRNTSVSNITNVTIDVDTGPVNHKISTGIEFSHEKSEANRYGTQGGALTTPANLPWATDVLNPNPDRLVPGPLNPSQDNGIKITTIAGYLYDTIKLNEQWQITGGLRAEKYTVDINSHDLATGAPVGLNGFHDSEFTLSGKVGVVYKPAENGSVYASFGISHLPPGSYLSNPDISRTDDNAFPGLIAGADPTRFHNYEIGTKWELFEKRLTLTAALFRTEKRNAPITGLDVGETGPATLKGYGQQIVQGLELGAAGKITDNWSVFGGLLLMDSKRVHSAYLDEVRMRANPGDFAAGPGAGGPWTSTNGDQLAFTPRVSANLWTTYLIPTTKLTVGGGVQYVGSSYLGRPDDAERIIPNGKYGKLPAYALVHLMASYEIKKGVNLRLNIDNVADTKYAVSANWGGTRAQLGPSRTYRVSTSFKF